MKIIYEKNQQNLETNFVCLMSSVQEILSSLDLIKFLPRNFWRLILTLELLPWNFEVDHEFLTLTLKLWAWSWIFDLEILGLTLRFWASSWMFYLDLEKLTLTLKFWGDLENLTLKIRPWILRWSQNRTKIEHLQKKRKILPHKRLKRHRINKKFFEKTPIINLVFNVKNGKTKVVQKTIFHLWRHC